MELKKLKQTMIFSVVIIVFGLFMMFFGIPREVSNVALWTSSDTGVDAQTMPYFATFIITIAATIKLVTCLLQYLHKKKSVVKDKLSVNWRAEFRALLMFALCIVYVIMFHNFGYIVATIIAPPIALLILGDRKWQHYLGVYSVAAVMYIIFKYALSINI